MKFNKEFILREIAGEYILIPTGKTTQEFNGLISLNEVAASIWKNIPEIDNVKEMVKIIMEEYDVDEITATADVENFLNELKEAKIII